MMTNELHELFCFLQDHVCVAEATITTTDGFDYKLEWKGDDCVVTQTLIHYL